VRGFRLRKNAKSFQVPLEFPGVPGGFQSFLVFSLESLESSSSVFFVSFLLLFCLVEG
jgi:hypothetical protein